MKTVSGWMSVLWLCVVPGMAQRAVTLSGVVRGGEKLEVVESATVCEAASGLWTLTDEHGYFELKGLAEGEVEVEIRTIGYRAKRMQVQLRQEMEPVEVVLSEDNLRLQEVSVTAQRAHASETTTYTIDRIALEHAQLLTVSDVTALLPGGKSQGDLSLMSDVRLALRSDGSGEMGNTSFGTAIEVDGMRLSQNNRMTLVGASTRPLAASNIERVEIVTGIPSVEYGDLSNGIVRVESRRGKMPWTVEGTVKPHTRMVALSKGWLLPSGGTLNVNMERAKSMSNLTSPYTSYDRNTLSLTYTHKCGAERPLLLTAHVSGNLGGYDAKSDPDNYLESYSKQRDYQVRGKVNLQWQLNRPGISALELTLMGQYADQQAEEKTHTSAASSVVQIHATTEGYNVGATYDEDPMAAVLLSPVGYWYRTAHDDSRPMQWTAHLKYQWNKRLGEAVRMRLKAGVDYLAEGNEGRGAYYDDMRTAPTWREARYDTLPWMHSLSAYAETHLVARYGTSSQWSLTAGLREDQSLIAGSEYGRVRALSPRVSTRLTLWEDERRSLSRVALHGGWGKAVKLPSMQVLYPATTYADQLAFAPGTMSDGRTYYAYYTMPSRALYNSTLKWQYALQTEVGAEADWLGTKWSLSLYRISTHRPYLATAVYRPYTYLYTGQAALEECEIPSVDRRYHIDAQTGEVTVQDRTGTRPDEVLRGTERRTYRGNTRYVNGSRSVRRGVEWVIDLKRIRCINTDIRIDGNAAYYRGEEHTLVQARPSSTLTMANGQPYAYIGHYDGSSTAGNGRLTRQLNTNVTVTTHLPVVRLILSVRLESTLSHYTRNLQSDGIIANGENPYLGEHSKRLDGQYVLVYPKYYSTWEEPQKLIPFEEALHRAYQENVGLYQELVKLIARTNTNYYFRPNRVSPYLAGHLNITKEIGDHVSVTFQATNFWNNTRRVRYSQTHSETTLYGSGLIQGFYYGLKVKVRV